MQDHTSVLQPVTEILVRRKNRSGRTNIFGIELEKLVHPWNSGLGELYSLQGEPVSEKQHFSL